MKVKILLSVLVGSFMFSCGPIGKYIPKPDMAYRVVRSFESDNKITILNAQTDKNEYDLRYQGLKMNYYEFTESVVKGLKAELKRNGVQVTDKGTDKILKVNINSISVAESGFVVITGKLSVQVEMGNGEQETIEVVRASGYGGFQTKNGRVKRVVNACYRAIINEILKNKRIKTYLVS